MTDKERSVEEIVEEIMSMVPKLQVVVEVGDGENDMVDLEEVLPYELTKFLQAERQKREEIFEHIRGDISAQNLILDELRKGNDMDAGDIEGQIDHELSAKIVLEGLLEALTQSNNPKV